MTSQQVGGFEVMPYSLTKDQELSRQPASVLAPLHALLIKRVFKGELCTVLLELGKHACCLNQDCTLYYHHPKHHYQNYSL